MPQLVNPFAHSAGSKEEPLGKLNVGDVEDFLNQEGELDDKSEEVKGEDNSDIDDINKDDKKDDDKKDDDKKKDEIELSDDEEESDKEEESDEEVEIDAPPKKRAILAKYPNFFKEFPAVEKIIYRDRQYSELFGSFDDAKELAEKAEVFNNYEQQLLSGNTESILKAVKESDPKAFDKIVDSYLDTLYRVDKDAFMDVISNFSKVVIMRMVNEAKRTNDEDLNTAAQILNKYLFATSEFTPPTKRLGEKRDNSKDEELEAERLSFVKERFETARDDLQSKVDNVLRSTINEYIDPRGVMSSYEKKNAVREAVELLHETISQDVSFRKNLDRLWQVAFSDKFSQKSLDRIRSTYLARSKDLLPTVIKKVRAEALKDSKHRYRDKNDESETSHERKAPINAGRPSQQRKEANRRQPGESVEEFFARD